MDFLLDNPIANLRGPQFLAFFAVVSVAAIVWAFLRSRAADETRALAQPQLPAEFDPFEIAYLRGGTPELTRLIILDLTARKYLQFTEAKRWYGTNQVIDVAPGHPDPKYLEDSERVVFGWMRGGKKADSARSARAIAGSTTTRRPLGQRFGNCSMKCSPAPRRKARSPKPSPDLSGRSG
jgi:uncharacterized protein (TIGR04222 family)